MSGHRLNSDGGFSLLEVMIVLAIISILAVVAVPAYISHIYRTRQAGGITRLLDIKTAQEKYYALNDTYCCDDMGASYAANDGGVDSNFRDMFNFDVDDTQHFTFTISSADYSRGFTVSSANDLNEDGSFTDCWQLSSPPADEDGDGNVDNEPAQVTGGGCSTDGEDLKFSLFNF